MPSADRVTGAITHHGEAPFWDSPNGRLLCVDLLAGAIVAVGEDGGAARIEVPSPVVSVIRRRRSGGFVIATERGAVASDDEFSLFEPLVEFTPDQHVRTNDGGCDPHGNFIVGTMAFDERAGGGAVYLLTPDHRVDEVLPEVSISNGVQWSGDGACAYHIDSPTRRVDAFDVDPETGKWSDRRTHIHVDATTGFPDGMAIDEEDGLWIALWGGGAVNHYDSQGRLVKTVRLAGVSQVSSCAFGGTDRSTLYITTSRQGIADHREPDAGAVFAYATDVRGATPSDFCG
jgi:sugar lactone lactonase YvrE